MNLPRVATACLLAVVGTSLAACTSSSGGADDNGAVTVTSTADRCALSTDTAPSGTVTFTIKNDGNQVTEFYLYAEDGKKVVGEVENIGPGLTRDFVVKVAPGKYVTACKPGMKGDGIRADFTVSDSGKDMAAISGVDPEAVEHATAGYAHYVRQQSTELLASTRAFVTAYKQGNDDTARHLYPRARVHWERIEPVAESFGDLDPRMDAREADLEQGQHWTGWHRLEKDLWRPAGFPALSDAERATYADKLLADTETLHGRVRGLEFSVDQIGNGAKSLFDEIATGKVTGEEEAWSHTDLYDFQANLDGAHEAFERLEGPLQAKDPGLAELIDTRFDALQHQLDRYRTHGGFVSYSTLSTAQVKRLSDSVNALSEPLARLTAAVAL